LRGPFPAAAHGRPKPPLKSLLVERRFFVRVFQRIDRHGRIAPVLRFFALFVLIQAALFGVELTPWAQDYFVLPWTSALARISTWLVTVFDPNVMAVGKLMRDTQNGFAVSIEAGCNGVEATIVLIAAILAFPAPWKHKLAGLAAGIVAVQGLNIVRVISLFYLGQWDRDWFEWAHLYVWQALIMLDVLIVWLIWVRTLPRTRSGGPPDVPPRPPRTVPATA
jgi:exosortase H (IPTLxxWG-CTERM-specific)